MRKLIKKILVFLFFPELKKKKPAPPTTIEKWQEYAEKLLIDSGIELENVLVHNYGQFGLAGKTFTNYTFHECDGINIKFKIPHPELPYIVVPEITGWWELRAWIHEIGHYVNKHYASSKPTYIKEYEAEKYSLDKANESGVVSGSNLIDMKFSAVSYLETHIDKAITTGEIKSLEDISDEIIQFIYQCNYMREVMKDKFIKLDEEIIKRNLKFDKYYR